jgi:hypothetical protein
LRTDGNKNQRRRAESQVSSLLKWKGEKSQEEDINEEESVG